MTFAKGGRITFIDSDRVIITYDYKDAGGRAARWTTHRMRGKLFKGDWNVGNPIGVINIPTPHHHHREIIRN